jgi:mycothiol synthase
MYEARPAVPGDLDQVVALLGQMDRALGVPFDPMREYFTWIWSHPATDLERDTRVVVEADTVIAFGQGTWQSDGGGPLTLLVRVHPDHQGLGLGTSLVSWGEALSSERGAEGVRTDVVDRDEPGHELLRSLGYRQVRSSYTMTKELTSDETAGTVPDGLTVRPYEDADDRVLFEVHEASFADHWGQRRSTFDAFNDDLHGQDWDPSLVFLAEAGDEVVGHAVAFAFEDEGYVALLGVVPAWRGRGIGRTLLRRSFAELAARGKRRARLEVDAENPHGAVALYEGVGMQVHRSYDIFDLGTGRHHAASAAPLPIPG